jgi:superkiller protein 3
MTGRRELAVSHFEESLRINPQYFKAALNAGEAWFSLGRPDLSLRRLHEAYRLRPDSSRVANDLGEVLETLGRREEAAGWYRTALSIEPGNGYAAAGLSRTAPGAAGGAHGAAPPPTP